MDSSCVHEVPQGAQVNLVAGEVTLSGKVISKLQRCAVPFAGSFDPSTTGGGSGGGTVNWYAFSYGNATTTHGLTQFNQLTTQWIVPPAPHVTDGSVVYLFPGLVNLINVNNWNAGAYSIFQPILQWGYNGSNGGEYWLMESAVSVNAAPYAGWFYGNPVQVTPGDTLTTNVYQDSSDSTGDGWVVTAWDNNTDQTSLGAWTVPATWPKYNVAVTGALEGYGNASETIPLNSCMDLPYTYFENFTSQFLDEAGPAWNTLNNACALVTWNLVADPYSQPYSWSGSPSCSWGAYTAGSCGSTNLVWWP